MIIKKRPTEFSSYLAQRSLFPYSVIEISACSGLHATVGQIFYHTAPVYFIECYLIQGLVFNKKRNIVDTKFVVQSAYKMQGI